MSLRERLEADMKEALRGRESVRLETIRGARGAIRNKEIELGASLDDGEIMRVIRGLTKQRAEAIEQYGNAGREDLVEKESAEKAILEAYLPAAPDEAQIERLVEAVIAEIGVSGLKGMGQVMKLALERLGPAADGKQVSAVVRRLLT